MGRERVLRKCGVACVLLKEEVRGFMEKEGLTAARAAAPAW